MSVLRAPFGFFLSKKQALLAWREAPASVERSSLPPSTQASFVLTTTLATWDGRSP